MITQRIASPADRLRAEIHRRGYTATDVLHLLLQGAPEWAADVLLDIYHEKAATK